MPLFRRSKKQKTGTEDKVSERAKRPAPLVATPSRPLPFQPDHSIQHSSRPPPCWHPSSLPQLPTVPHSCQGSHPYRCPAPVPSMSAAQLLPPAPPYSSAPIRDIGSSTKQQKWASCTNLVPATDCPYIGVIHDTVSRTANYVKCSAGLCSLIGDKFYDVMTLIDEDAFRGTEEDLLLSWTQPPALLRPYPQHANQFRGGQTSPLPPPLTRDEGPRPRKADCAITAAAVSHTANVFSKASLYANSVLPPNLPPLRVYIPTYPLLCLAAQYSENAYHEARGAEADAYVRSDWRMGTKAMVIKSVPLDDMNMIVFAIRGTAGVLDWSVNFRAAPKSPNGFLDDPGNLCHAGFLEAAKRMIKPVAARLRQLLEENPSRAACSLIVTGHSAGGAVASLLYCHMLAENVKSELNILTGCFKRIHCITFGAPPVSLLPLAKPVKAERRLRKSLFLSFVNEGDPISRAEKGYVRNLLELYANPAPRVTNTTISHSNALVSSSKVNLLLIGGKKAEKGARVPARPSLMVPRPSSDRVWKVPQATLSNAGRIVALRVPWNGRDEDVKACIVTDAQLRGVVFGDPLMHRMTTYAQRIDVLATKAVRGRLFQ